MPNHENVLQGAQSAPRADVLPTKQASNESIPTVSIEPVEIPSQEVLEHAGTVSWKGMFKIPSKFTAQPEIYLITITGTLYDWRDQKTREVCREYYYEEYHPHLAIGKATYEFMRSSSRSHIHDIIISKRVVKKTK